MFVPPVILGPSRSNRRRVADDTYICICIHTYAWQPVGVGGCFSENRPVVTVAESRETTPRSLSTCIPRATTPRPRRVSPVFPLRSIDEFYNNHGGHAGLPRGLETSLTTSTRRDSDTFCTRTPHVDFLIRRDMRPRINDDVLITASWRPEIQSKSGVITAISIFIAR